jgi:hypothetical protein
VRVVKTGAEYFEVVGDVSKSRVLAGEITVSIKFLCAERSLRILDFRIRWNGHVNVDASISLRKLELMHRYLPAEGETAKL